MIEDDILKEIRATREAFAAEHNYDIHSMFETLRAEEAASGRAVVSFPPRTVTSGTNPGVGTPMTDMLQTEGIKAPSAA